MGTTSQVVDVHSCLDGSCSDYVETWVVVTRTQTASSTETAISTQCSVSSGLNTVPVIATVHPSGNPDFTAAVTTTCQVTTYVASAGVIDITTIVIVTFTDISFNTVINGITQSPTAPAVNPANPTGISGGNGGGGLVQYTTSTIYATQVSTIINCPAQATICPAQSTIFITQTISVGITVFPVPTASLTSGGVSPTTSPSITPSAPAAVGNFEYIGCLASTEGFTTFNLELTSAQMDIELCTSECETLMPHILVSTSSIAIVPQLWILAFKTLEAAHAIFPARAIPCNHVVVMCLLPNSDAAIYLQVVLSMSLRLYQQQRLLQLLHQPHLVLQTRHLTPTQKSSNETSKPTWTSFPLREEVPKLSSSDKEECFDTSARLRELLPQNAISASSRSSGFRTEASSFHLAPYES